jgi:hypothetical protein
LGIYIEENASMKYLFSYVEFCSYNRKETIAIKFLQNLLRKIHKYPALSNNKRFIINKLSLVYRKAEFFLEAASLLEDYLRKLTPNSDIFAITELGIIYFKLGRTKIGFREKRRLFTLSENCFLDAMKLDEENLAPYQQLGIMLQDSFWKGTRLEDSRYYLEKAYALNDKIFQTTTPLAKIIL